MFHDMQTPYYVFGALLIIGGLISCFSNMSWDKRKTLLDYLRLSEKAKKRVFVISGIIFIFFGLNLIAKGYLDPYTKSMWIHFS